jgi:gas vesicle protein
MPTRSTPPAIRAASGAPTARRGASEGRDVPRTETAAARAGLVAGRLSALPRLAAERVREVRAGVRDRLTRRPAAPRAGVSTAHTADADLGARGEEGGTDWGRVGVFGAGLAIGALLGAGTALLLAPSSGFETRVRLARGARRAGTRVADRWDDLGDAVRRKAHRSRTQVERKLTRGRWAAEDAWERRLLRARARAAERDA